MKTFSVFCIGTHHTAAEEYNLLTVLHRLTAAADVGNNGKANAGINAVPNGALQHHRVLYDGPPDLPDVWGKPGAATHMVAVRDNAVSLIRSVNLPAQPAGGPKMRVNLVGHSRGAVNCLMIASELHKNLQDAQNYECRLFLLDAVKVTDIRSSQAKVPEVDTRFIYSNVKELVHIIMEDDVKFVKRKAGMRFKAGIFRLYEIEEASGRPGPGGASRIKGVRFPGTHGTATQCNPMNDGSIPPMDGSLLGAKPERLWPIGGAALAFALTKLKEWMSPLDPEGDRLTEDDYWLLHFYSLIQIANPIVNRKKRKRVINNAALSTQGQIQESSVIPGEDRVTYRSDKLLAKFASNGYRFHPIFVNEHHFELCETHFSADLLNIIANLVDGAGPKDLKMVGSVRFDATEFAQYEANIERVKWFNPGLFSLLADLGFNWNGIDLHTHFN